MERKTPDIQALSEAILKGDRIALSRGITLVESRHPDHRTLANQLVRNCIHAAGNAKRIGISGAPGVGKSTFIESFGKQIIQSGSKIAVLAVDPSSPVSKGSILGDKTRMDWLSRNGNAYIRPSPAGDTLGGVARSTREAIVLCEASGFDYVIVETVGVGQSETAVRNLVDFFVLLLLPGAGDDLQGIKKGIVEMADIIVINKADGENMPAVKKAIGFYASALHLLPMKHVNWQVPVMSCSALFDTGMEKVLQKVAEYFAKIGSFVTENRQHQSKYWLKESVLEKLQEHFFSQESVALSFSDMEQKVENGHIQPFEAADQIFAIYLDALKK